MNDRTEVLLRYYEENASQARQHEMQRERLTFLIFFISAAGFGLIVENPEENAAWLAAIAIILLSAYGCVLSLKHYERNRYHDKIMKSVLDQISSELERAAADSPSGSNGLPLRRDLDRILDEAKRHGQCHFPWLHKRRLHIAWAYIPALIGFIALATLALVLCRRAAADDVPEASEVGMESGTLLICSPAPEGVLESSEISVFKDLAVPERDGEDNLSLLFGHPDVEGPAWPGLKRCHPPRGGATVPGRRL